MKTIQLIPACFALGALTACSSIYNGPTQAVSIEEEHPISVEQQTVTLTISVDPTLTELTNIDKARLRAFTGNYFTRGQGPMTVTAPSGGRLDFNGQELASDIRQELHALGMDWSLIKGATYRISADASEMNVIVSFSNYVASSAKCGDWSEEFPRRMRNLRSKNFGCFSQQNLAAMVSDPRDLIAPTPLADGEAARVLDTYGKFVRGESTSSAADDAIEVEATEN